MTENFDKMYIHRMKTKKRKKQTEKGKQGARNNYG